MGTRELVASAMEERPGTDVDFLLGIIQQNTNIPVLLTDSEGNILDQRNFRLPAPDNSSDPRNTEYLGRKLGELKSSPRRIEIDIAPGVVQYLYYEDSTLLRRMSVFPYIQLLVMLAFIAVVYFAVLSTKKAEQNKVWVGLSKETAHQLGTPISSLMAWMELLPDYGVDADTLAEMSKDVNRLSTIASRFSKIGSEPRMELVELRTVVAEAVDYMGTRISPRISLTFNPGTADDPQVMACTPLLEWVIENLIKNAVDAMEGSGKIDVSLDATHTMAAIEVADTGKASAGKISRRCSTPATLPKAVAGGWVSPWPNALSSSTIADAFSWHALRWDKAPLSASNCPWLIKK